MGSLFRNISLPVLVVQLREVVLSLGDQFQILAQVIKFAVFVVVFQRLSVWLDLQAATRVHQKVSSHVVEHDGVLGRILVVFSLQREFLGTC